MTKRKFNKVLFGPNSFVCNVIGLAYVESNYGIGFTVFFKVLSGTYWIIEYSDGCMEHSHVGET